MAGKSASQPVRCVWGVNSGQERAAHSNAVLHPQTCFRGDKVVLSSVRAREWKGERHRERRKASHLWVVTREGLSRPKTSCRHGSGWLVGLLLGAQQLGSRT